MEEKTYNTNKEKVKALPQKEELELIQNIKAGDDNSLTALIKQHSGTVIHIMDKYLPSVYNSGTYFQDVFGEKDYIIYKAAESFSPSKNVKFSTWVSEQTKYHCLKALTSASKIKLEDSDILNQRVESNSEFISNSDKSLDSKYILHIIGQFSDERIKYIFKKRHFNNKDKPTPYYKIARQLKLSTQQCLNLYNKGREMLKHKLQSNECFDCI